SYRRRAPPRRRHRRSSGKLPRCRDGFEVTRHSHLARRSCSIASRRTTARHWRREIGERLPRRPYATRQPEQRRAWRDGAREEVARPRRIGKRVAPRVLFLLVRIVVAAFAIVRPVVPRLARS